MLLVERFDTVVNRDDSSIHVAIMFFDVENGHKVTTEGNCNETEYTFCHFQSSDMLTQTDTSIIIGQTERLTKRLFTSVYPHRVYKWESPD